MNKTHHFSDKHPPEKLDRRLITQGQPSYYSQPKWTSQESNNYRLRRPSALLAIVVASLSSYLIAAPPSYAGFNIPTDSTASPLCVNGQCASAFTAKLLMFEEFGNQAMPSTPSPNSGSSPGPGLPEPVDCQSSPDSLALDNFLKGGLQPFPTRAANEDVDAECLGR